MKKSPHLLCILSLLPLLCLAEDPAPSPGESPASATPSPSASPAAPAPSATPAAQSSATPAQDDTGGMKIATAQPVEDVDVMTRLQIFLDQQKFGPGKI